ncbi:hypothetical protein C8R44DRAFT_781814 [Mycena epipterygia]|nr:hypothetical protein C8R44DRAFT_781814 [Mycena epipterygia]
MRRHLTTLAEITMPTISSTLTTTLQTLLRLDRHLPSNSARRTPTGLMPPLLVQRSHRHGVLAAVGRNLLPSCQARPSNKARHGQPGGFTHNLSPKSRRHLCISSLLSCIIPAHCYSTYRIPLLAFFCFRSCFLPGSCAFPNRPRIILALSNPVLLSNHPKSLTSHILFSMSSCSLYHYYFLHLPTSINYLLQWIHVRNGVHVGRTMERCTCVMRVSQGRGS